MGRSLLYAKPLALKVFMSCKYVYAQAVHLPTAQTIAAAASSEKEMRANLRSTSDKEAAACVGRAIALRLQAQDIHAIVHELKEGQRYHGKLKALLDGIRDAGVQLL